MSHSWTYDAPSGVYKNHALSSDIRMAAIAETARKSARHAMA